MSKREESGLDAARLVLRSYLEKVLFDESNTDGELLREALFAARDAKSQEALRRRLLDEVALWGPGAPEWRQVETRDSTVFTGRLLQLWTEIALDAKGGIARASVSLD